MTNEETITILQRLKVPTKRGDGKITTRLMVNMALEKAIKALEQEPILDKIRAEIEMYEADCRLQGGTDECEKCNSNVFGSIYRIIDKYKAESEES